MPLSAEVERQVAALIEGSKNGEFLVRNVQEILRRNSLLTTMRIPHMAVGVHPQNRDGAALVTQDVHELLESIVQVGFTPSHRGRQRGRKRVQQTARDVCRLAAGPDGLCST